MAKINQANKKQLPVTAKDFVKIETKQKILRELNIVSGPSSLHVKIQITENKFYRNLVFQLLASSKFCRVNWRGSLLLKYHLSLKLSAFSETISY